MAQVADTQVRIDVFAGMNTNVDPKQLRGDTSRTQTNVTSNVRQAELIVRRGMRELTFDPEE
jgi:hypothetical protein